MGQNIREDVAIVDLILYIPLALAVLFVLIRHGFQKQLGWIYLLIFTIVRVAGAVLELLHTHNPSNESYLEWALILSSVGISPLLLSTLGLLKRVTDCTSTYIPSGDPNPIVSVLSSRLGIFSRIAGKATANSRRSRFIQLLQLPATIALILCIAGGTSSVSGSATPSEVQSGSTETKAGIAIFIAIYIVLSALAAYNMSELRQTPVGERRILLAVLLALPFIGSRLLWSALCSFHQSSTFNIVDGSAVVQICMADVEELLVVVMYVAVGMVVSKYDEVDDEERIQMGAKGAHQYASVHEASAGQAHQGTQATWPQPPPRVARDSRDYY